MKKMLLIANPQNKWVQRFISNVLTKLPFDLYVAVDVRQTNKEDIEFLIENNCKIIEITNSRFRKIPLWGSILRYVTYCKKIKNAAKYDGMIVVNIIRFRFLLGRYFVDKIPNSYFLYWGSDLLREPEHNIKRQQKVLDKLTGIVLTTDMLNKKVEEYFGPRYRQKTHIIGFGTDPIQKLNEIKRKISKSDAKGKFGINEKNVTVSIGYSGRKEQQHIKVLDSIKGIEKSGITVILQFMYDGTEEYQKEVEEKAREYGFDYIILDNYLKVDDIALLRLSTDIFINAQTTDACAGSILESIYAGAILINAKWLHYKELDKYDIDYYEFEEFQDLESIVNQVLVEYPTKNIRDLTSLCVDYSWDKCFDKWKNLLLK